jgi:hypothetical protein
MSSTTLKPSAPLEDEMIYCIYSPHMSFVKLGRTAGSIDALCKRYRTPYPNFEHYTFNTGPNSRGAEQHLFGLLNTYRLGRSECFTCSRETALHACRHTQAVFLGQDAEEFTMSIKKYKESNRLFLQTFEGDERLLDVSVDTLIRLDHDNQEMERLVQSFQDVTLIIAPPPEEVPNTDKWYLRAYKWMRKARATTDIPV